MSQTARCRALLAITLLAPPLAATAHAAGPLDTLPAPPADGLRVYLVRHGQAFSNLDPAPDLPADQLDRLTDLGKQQAEKTGAALAGKGLTVVLTSPAGRARETAERIASALRATPPRVEPRLRPLDLGRSADGKPLDWDARIAEWKAGRDSSPPGGESLSGLGDRVAGLLSSLLAEGPPPPAPGGSRSVVLVAHGEVIASYLGRLRGTPPAKRYPPGLRNASVTVVDVTARGASERLVDYRPEAP